MVDVFISYSRRDKQFVQRLHQALEDNDRNAWVDWQDIPLGTAWWQEIQNGIEASDTFIFVITPDSIASKVCRQEIDHAVLYRKRLMPIVRREGFDPELMHPSLSEHNWLFFREQDDFDQAFQALLEAIDTDLNHVRTHTRLLVRAIEWESNGRNDSFLLRGNDLAAAEQWLNQCAEKKPSPAEQHKNYITKSREAENASLRVRRMVGIGAGVMGVMLAIATTAALHAGREIQAATAQVEAAEERGRQLANERDRMAQQVDQSNRNLKQAQAKQEEAETKIKAANQKLTAAEQQATAATQQAKQAETQTAQARVAQQQAQTAAQQARVQQQQAQQQAQNALDRQAQIEAEAIQLQRVTQLERQGAGLLRLPSTQFQQIDTLIDAMELGQSLRGIQTSNASSTRLLDKSSTENLLLALRRSVNQVLESNRLPGIYPVFSPDEQLIATSLNDTSYLYDRFSNRLLELPGTSPIFSPDGELFAITTFDASDDTGDGVSEVHVYDRSGNRLLELPGTSPIFSPDGELIAIITFDASDDTGDGVSEVHVYDRSGNRLLELPGASPIFSPDGELIAIIIFDASDDTGSSVSEVHVYDRSGNPLWELTGNPSTFAPDTSNLNEQLFESPMLFSPDGQWIAIVPPESNRSYVYNLSGDRIAELPGTYLSSSPNGEWIAAISSDSSDDTSSSVPEVHVYNRSINRVLELQGNNFTFSPDGELIAITTSNSSDGTSSSVPKVHVYDRSGDRLLELSGTFPSFSPNGELIAITAFNSSDGTSSNAPKVHVYDRSGKRLLELSGTTSTFTSDNSNPNEQLFEPSIELFSPDGQWIATVSPRGDSRYLYNLSNRSNERVAELSGTELSFSPDEELIAAIPLNRLGFYSSYTHVYNRSSERTLQLQGIFDSFSQDGRSIITVSPDGTSSYAYDRSGNRVSEFQGIELISSSQDGQSIVVTATYPFMGTSSDAYTHIHDSSNNPSSALTGRFLGFGLDGQVIATVSPDYNSYLYDRSTNRTLELQGIYLFDPYRQLFSSFSPDGQLIVTVSPDNTSYLYDRSGKLIAELQGNNPVFSPDGQSIANSLFADPFGYGYGSPSDSIDSHSYLYDRSGNRIGEELQGNNPIFSPDGQLIVTSLSADPFGYGYGSPSDSIDSYSYLYDRSGNRIGEELQGNNPIFSPDGQLIVTSPPAVPFGYGYGPPSDSIDSHSYLYDRSGNLITELQGNYSIFSPDGQLIVTSLSADPFRYGYGSPPDSTDDRSYLYDHSGNLITKLEGSNPIFSPDGQLIVTSPLADPFGYGYGSSPDSTDDRSYLYDHSGNLITELQGNYSIFSPDGQLIVTTSLDGKTNTLYDRSGNHVADLQGQYPTFSPDGQFIATTSSDSNTSIVYNRSGDRVTEYPGSEPAFSPDGEYLITYVSDNRSQMWQLDDGLDDLLAQGCNLLRGYFVTHPRALERLPVCQGANANLSPSTRSGAMSYEVD